MSHLILVIFVLLLAILITFLPIIVGVKRGVRNMGLIWIIWLLLAWTAIGWLVALGMACTMETRENVRAMMDVRRPRHISCRDPWGY